MKRIIVASHVSDVYAPTYALIRFLKKNFSEPICVLHPFKKRLVWLHFLKDFLVTLFLSFYYLNRYDIFIGVNCLNCFPGVLVRFLSQKKILVYYSADYSAKRFSNPLFARLYVFLDKFCSQRADFNWSVSERICAIKRGFGIGDERNILVQNGVHLEDIKTYNCRIRNSLFYVGHLTKTKGVQDVIRGLESLSGYQLFIIGDGPFKEELCGLVSYLNLSNRVYFLGRVENREVLRKIGEFEIGLAPYTADEDYVYYCDPVKIKEYLAAGCPVVVSRAVWISDEVERRLCGVAVENFAGEMAGAVKMIEKDFGRKSRNARNLAKKYDWSDIYAQALAKIKI